MKNNIVGIAEIAEMFKVTKQAVGNWKVRYSDFPVPCAKLAMGPIFYKEDIKSWGQKHYKL